MGKYANSAQVRSEEESRSACKMPWLAVCLTCIAHVGLPAQLAPTVRAEVELSEACASLVNLPRQNAFGLCCLSGPGPGGQHLHHNLIMSLAVPLRLCILFQYPTCCSLTLANSARNRQSSVVWNVLQTMHVTANDSQPGNKQTAKSNRSCLISSAWIPSAVTCIEAWCYELPE